MMLRRRADIIIIIVVIVTEEATVAAIDIDLTRLLPQSTFNLNAQCSRSPTPTIQLRELAHSLTQYKHATRANNYNYCSKV